MKESFRSSHISLSLPAVSKVISSFSITHGPAINAKGFPFPIRICPTLTSFISLSFAWACHASEFISASLFLSPVGEHQKTLDPETWLRTTDGEFKQEISYHAHKVLQNPQAFLLFFRMELSAEMFPSRCLKRKLPIVDGSNPWSSSGAT
jgi:hypothetical protein